MKELKEDIESSENPRVISISLMFFLSDALSEESVSLYEAYSINGYRLRFERLGYIQPAWQGRVQISSCIALLNHYLLASYFDEEKEKERFREWLLESVRLNEETREHYIIDRIEDFLDTTTQGDALRELQRIRKVYDSLSDELGPFHNESFPDHCYSPEDLLLSGACSHSKKLSKAIEDLIVQLEIKNL